MDPSPLEKWAKALNQNVFPICVGGIVTALGAPAADRYTIAFGALLVAWIVLLLMIFNDAPVVGDLRMSPHRWRQKNLLANDVARTAVPHGPLLQRAWPTAVSWFVLSAIALDGAVKGLGHG